MELASENSERISENAGRLQAMAMSLRRVSRATLIEAARKEAAELVKTAARPDLSRETIKTQITQAANNLGWTRTRTRDIWYGQARDIKAHEMDQLRRLTPGISSENSDSGG